MATIVVSGALANRYGNGGGAWVRLDWLLGLQRLGHEVYFVEQIARQHCIDEQGKRTFEGSINLAFFDKVVQRFGLGRHSALICDQGEQVHGIALPEILHLAQHADVLINLGGHLVLKPILERVRRKVYVDLDPGFTQIWHAAGNPGANLAGHDFYFTVGTNIGKRTCSIPAANVRWRPFYPPVVLQEWPATLPQASGRFTTVASWRGPFGPLRLGAKVLGLKVHEFRKFFELPQRTGQSFELALDIHADEVPDLNQLRAHGWHLVDPHQAAGDPDRFRCYLQSSCAEFSVAKGVYVDTGTGWFSDRTAAYLASGKPALVQDTGLTGNLPMGQGLLTFRTLEEAVAGVMEIVRNYDQHCRAARVLAETFFDSDKVLGSVLEEAGL